MNLIREFHADTFSNCPRNTYTSVLEYGSPTEYSSNYMNTRPTKRQKKTLVTDSDMESENETHHAGEYSFASTEECIEDYISQKLEKFTGMSGVTSECNNP